MCWKCKTPLTFSGPITRDDECPVCHASVRSCRNCAFYAPGSHYDCHETVDECVNDKERANFCAEFKLAPQGDSLSGGADKAKAARSAFDALFSI